MKTFLFIDGRVESALDLVASVWMNVRGSLFGTDAARIQSNQGASLLAEKLHIHAAAIAKALIDSGIQTDQEDLTQSIIHQVLKDTISD